MTTQTWIITGASRGLGRALAEAALAAGDNVVAAVRTPGSVADLADAHPGAFLAIPSDARDVAAAPALVQAATNRFGQVDVLVNNAGRAVVGAVEEVGDEQVRELMDLHLFGPAALVRAVLPGMRTRGSGTIVQMSSQGGRMAFPGVSAYSASKFALEGWSEALAGEVAPFGVRAMIVEPSRFRTGFNGADVLEFAEPSETYRQVLAAVRADMAGTDGRQEGDPARAAEIIVSLVHGDEVPLRLPLGREAVERISGVYRRGLAETARWAEVADRLALSAHTLRYYERAGLVTVARDSQGHRVYDADAVRRLVFLTRMRLSGMSMRELQHYIELVDAGERTVPERMAMLAEHRDTIVRRLRELTLSLAAVDYKITTYGGATGSDVERRPSRDAAA